MGQRQISDLNRVGNRRIDLVPFHVGSVFSVKHIHGAAHVRVLAKFTDRQGGFATLATARHFGGQQFNRVVHADSEHIFKGFEVGICAATFRRGFGVFQIGAVAPDVGKHTHAVLWMGSQEARQRQQFDGCFKRDLFWWPFFGDRLAVWFWIVVGQLTALGIGAKATLMNPDFVALVDAKFFTLGRNAGCVLSTGGAKGAGVFAFGIV